MVLAEEGRPRPHAELQHKLLDFFGHLSTVVSLDPSLGDLCGFG